MYNGDTTGRNYLIGMCILVCILIIFSSIHQHYLIAIKQVTPTQYKFLNQETFLLGFNNDIKYKLLMSFYDDADLKNLTYSYSATSIITSDILSAGNQSFYIEDLVEACKDPLRIEEDNYQQFIFVFRLKMYHKILSDINSSDYLCGTCNCKLINNGNKVMWFKKLTNGDNVVQMLFEAKETCN